MRNHQRFYRAFCTAVFTVGLLSACGGSHSTGSSIPTLPGGTASTAATLRSALSAGTNVVAINAGGSAAGSFAADQDFVAAGTWSYKTTAAIDTSGVTNPGAQAVYQDDREGSAIAYTIPGLVAGAAYTVRLSFAELWWTAAGQRSFNVSINNTKVLTSFDVFATAGKRNKAVTESFAATASSTGTIAINLNAVTNNATISAIEISSGGVSPTPPPGASVLINSGGGASGNFAADTDFAANGSWTYNSTHAISTAGVTNPAPQGVYQSQRAGSTIAYTLPGLTAGANYTVRLDFAELYWTARGQRVFNVSINNTRVLTNFDIVGTAGTNFSAVGESFTATAAADGSIAITLTSVTNYATVNGIEVTPGSGPPPSPPPAASFNDYTTFGYDNQRDVFNPNSTAITPASASQVHLAWQTALGDYNTQSQPVLATEIPGHSGVLFVGGGTGKVYGYDALSGKRLWTTSIGQESYSLCGSGTYVFGIGGTVAYDPASKSLYVVGNTNPALNAYADNGLYHLDAASGHVLGQVNFTPTAAGANELNFSHTSVTLNNGIAYVGTGSTCDISSWRGRVAAVNVPTMTLSNTFFTVWDPQNARGAGAQPWSGGGVWGWGGVSLDFSGNVLTGVGNTDDGSSPQGQIRAPFAAAPHEYSGYGETLLELSPNIATVIGSNHPIPLNTYNGTANDIDVQGTPLIFRPNGAGCGTMAAVQGKSGELSFYDEARLNSGTVAQYQLAPSTYADGYLGSPAYSPATGLVYAPVASSTSPTLFAPGLIAVNPGCGSPSVAWHAAFGSDSSGAGIPRSVPAVSAGGVVFAGTVNGSGGDVWEINASTGALLNGGSPVLHTSGNLRVPPTIDGNWIFILDNDGNMYGLTIDPSYPTIQAKARAVSAQSRRKWNPSHH